MQITEGSARPTYNSVTVTAHDADWSGARIGAIFKVVGRPTNYRIIAFTSSTLTLETPYYETADGSTDFSYIIATDFSPQFSLPLLSAGDVETAALYSRAMMIIDSALQTTVNGEGLGNLYVVSNTFQVGNAVRVNSSGVIVLGSADSVANAQVIGLITSCSSTQFTIKPTGFVSGITGITLVTGTVYYLTSTAGQPNLTATAPAGNLKVPVLVALSASSGIILSSAATSPSTAVGADGTHSGVTGLVPAPGATDNTKFLKGDMTYANPPAAGLHAVDQSHLSRAGTWTSPADWVAIASAPDTVKSVYLMLVDLNTRLAGFEGGSSVMTSMVVFTIDLFSSGSTTWTIPAGKTALDIEIWGGGGMTQAAVNGLGEYRPAGYARGVLTGLTPTSVLTIHIGKGAASTGNATTTGGTSQVLLGASVLAQATGGSPTDAGLGSLLTLNVKGNTFQQGAFGGVFGGSSVVIGTIAGKAGSTNTYSPGFQGCVIIRY